MTSEQNPIWKTLADDEENVSWSRRLLEETGLMGLFEAVPGLFAALPREVEAASREDPLAIFVRTLPDGQHVPAWDFILRVTLIQSASMQFLHCMGHLLRGHSLEIFGHARTMIENAGISYLSKTEPDLGELYKDGDSSFKNRTASARILPPTDPVTAQLNESFRLSSELFHSNFVSVIGRTAYAFEHRDERFNFSNTMNFHDVDPDKPEIFLRNATWLLRASVRVLRVFAAAFGLPDCVWYRRLEQIERDVDAAFTRLAPTIAPRGRQP